MKTFWARPHPGLSVMTSPASRYTQDKLGRENGTGTYLGLLLVPLGRGRAPGESVMRGVGVSMGVGGRVGVRPAAQTVQRGRS